MKMCVCFSDITVSTAVNRASLCTSCKESFQVLCLENFPPALPKFPLMAWGGERDGEWLCACAGRLARLVPIVYSPGRSSSGSVGEALGRTLAVHAAVNVWHPLFPSLVGMEAPGPAVKSSGDVPLVQTLVIV